MNDKINPDAQYVRRWGIYMLEVEARGLSFSVHHDDYPQWTCRLWRDVGSTHINVEAKAWSGIDALAEALAKVAQAQP